jgi:hypothetical protein
MRTPLSLIFLLLLLTPMITADVPFGFYETYPTCTQRSPVRAYNFSASSFDDFSGVGPAAVQLSGSETVTFADGGAKFTAGDADLSGLAAGNVDPGVLGNLSVHVEFEWSGTLSEPLYLWNVQKPPDQPRTYNFPVGTTDSVAGCMIVMASQYTVACVLSSFQPPSAHRTHMVFADSTMWTPSSGTTYLVTMAFRKYDVPAGSVTGELTLYINGEEMDSMEVQGNVTALDGMDKLSIGSPGGCGVHDGHCGGFMGTIFSLTISSEIYSELDIGGAWPTCLHSFTPPEEPESEAPQASFGETTTTTTTTTPPPTTEEATTTSLAITGGGVGTGASAAQAMNDREGESAGQGALLTIVAVCAGVAVLVAVLVTAFFVRRSRRRREVRPIAIGAPRDVGSSLPAASNHVATRSKSRDRSRRPSQSRTARAASSSNYAAISVASANNEYTEMVSLDGGSVDSSSYVTLSLDGPTTRTHGYATATSYATIDPTRRSEHAPADDYQQGNLELF